MGSYSVYDVAESGPAKWRPGEELAASGFVAIVFYLFVDINLSIYRIFQRKQGLYYWCMLLGTWGCLIDSIAVIVKFFVHNSEPLWPLYTLFILLGWTIYAPAQLLALYSRLHLINRNRKLQRWVFILIIAVSALMIIPTWIFVWQAYNPHDAHLSSLYSPREAILDRCTQLGYTFVESVLSGIYIYSLTKLLKFKSSVRQRRVMTDLIYVNLIAVCLDILTVVLVYLNQTGSSHPVQTFSYILKLKLEFLVLNQLMAVAAKGVRKESFAERRYHQSFASVGGKSKEDASGETFRSKLESDEGPGSNGDSTRELVVPSPTLSKAREISNGSGTRGNRHDDTDKGRWPMKAKVKKHDIEDDEDEEEEIGVHMWEKRGKLVMEVPWFRTEGHA